MTKLHRTRITDGDPAEFGMLYRVADDQGDDSGKEFRTHLWRLFMPETADQKEFEKAKADAVAFVAEIERRSNNGGAIKLLVHGDNAKVGDSCSSPDTVDPIRTLRDTAESVYSGEWSARSGSADLTTETWREIVARDARKDRARGGLSLNKTKANDRAKDDLAKLESDIAKVRKMAVADYRAGVEKRVAAELEA